MSPTAFPNTFLTGCFIAGLGVNSAVSSEAEVLQKLQSSAVDEIERSQSLFGPKQEAISELRSLVAEHAEPDWDGSGALPLSSEACLVAEAIIRLFPDDLPLPEFAADPDGEISMDWIVSSKRMFSLSVDASARLACAWVSGTDHGHEVVRFDGVALPDRVVFGIHQVVRNSRNPDRLRVA